MRILNGTVGSEISLLDAFIRIMLSIIIGSIIGYEREKKNRPAGLRTHALVCMAASLIAMVEQQMIYEISLLDSLNINLSFGRLSVGVITGIGFIGAGTIMMSKSKVIGLTTAASLWCTACLGLINGMGYCFVAVTTSLLIILILQVLRFGEKRNLNRIIEVEYLYSDDALANIDTLLQRMNVKVNDYSLSFYKENENKYCTSRYSIIFKDKNEINNVMSKLADLDFVRVVKIENAMW